MRTSLIGEEERFLTHDYNLSLFWILISSFLMQKLFFFVAAIVKRDERRELLAGKQYSAVFFCSQCGNKKEAPG